MTRPPRAMLGASERRTGGWGHGPGDDVAGHGIEEMIAERIAAELAPAQKKIELERIAKGSAIVAWKLDA